MSTLRFITALLLAPLAALIVLGLIAVGQLNDGADVLTDGTLDDASQRGARMFLLVAMPLLFVWLAGFHAAAGHVLRKMNLLALEMIVLLHELSHGPF